jgi:hypothetical protein
MAGSPRIVARLTTRSRTAFRRARVRQGRALGGAEEAPSLTAAARDGDGNMRSGRKNARRRGSNKRMERLPLDKASPYKPYRGKPALRHLRGDDGNVGIIRSPVRAIVLPDQLAFVLKRTLVAACFQGHHQMPAANRSPPKRSAKASASSRPSQRPCLRAAARTIPKSPGWRMTRSASSWASSGALPNISIAASNRRARRPHEGAHRG